MLRSIERIEGADDPRVSAYRALADPLLLRERAQFIAEGRLVVRRVIDDGRYAIRSLLVNEAALRGLAAALDALDPAAPVYLCDTALFHGITGFNIHRGCLALVDRPADRSVDAALARAQTAIVLESVTNPDNVGGVFRNAAAFGADAVILSPECADPLYRKSIRTSMGAVLRVPFARTEQWPAAIDAIRGQGFAIVALTPREPSVPIDEWRTGQAGRVGQVGQVGKVALLVGAEGAGLSDEAASLADVRLRIPISDAVDSLNLAVAVGIALHDLRPRM